MHKDIENILITEEQIINKSKELGAQISKDYEGNPPIVVGLLKGSVAFLAELVKYITIDVEIDFMDVSSYSGTKQADVRIIKDLETPIRDKEVLVVEDIVDSGKTIEKVKQLLIAKGAKRVKIVSLLNKKETREVDVEPDYYGFAIPDVFVVGFGLDYNEKYRNLPYIGAIKKSAIVWEEINNEKKKFTC